MSLPARILAPEVVDPSEPGREIELKYMVEPLALRRFSAAIEGFTTPEVHDPQRPVAYTRTTYLDTPGRDYFRSVAPRRRLRVREYASARSTEDEPLLTGVCFLELKESLDGMRRKVRWRASSALVRSVVARGGRLGVERGAPDELLLRLSEDGPTPLATTWYRRRAFVAPGAVRITIDDPPWLCRPATPGHKGAPALPDEPIAVMPHPVFVVKLGGPMPGWLEAALASLPPARSVSKFRLAVGVL